MPLDCDIDYEMGYDPLTDEQAAAPVTQGEFRKYVGAQGRIQRTVGRQVGEMHKAMITDVDGKPGMAQQVTTNTKAIKSLMNNSIPWMGVLKVMAALGSGITFMGIVGGAVWLIIQKLT